MFDDFLLRPEEFGKSVRPQPKTRSMILQLCKKGRVCGARMVNGRWMIPAGAQILGSGRRIDYGRNKGISVIEYARTHGVNRQRVYQLLNHPTGSKIAGARKTTHGWDIPRESPWPSDDWQREDGSQPTYKDSICSPQFQAWAMLCLQPRLDP